MALYGQLSTMSLMDLLQWAGLNRKNGVFELERNKISKKLLFNGGKVVACYSNDPQSRLGQFLLSRGKVDREQLQDALRRQQATGESLGAILLDLNLITEKELTSLMSQKAEEMILSLFDWQEAIFRFEEKGSLGPYVIEVDLSVDDILLKGLQRVDELSIIRRVFPDSGLVLELTGKTVPQEVENSSMASRIVKAVNGERTIAEVMLHTNSSDFLVLKFLYNLFNRGVLQIMGRRETGETVTIVDPWRKQAEGEPESMSLDMLDAKLPSRSEAGAPSVFASDAAKRSRLGASAQTQTQAQASADATADPERTTSAQIDDVLGGLTAPSQPAQAPPAEAPHSAIDDAPRFEIDDPFAADGSEPSPSPAAPEAQLPLGADSPFVVAEEPSDAEGMEQAIDQAANIFAAHDSLSDSGTQENAQEAEPAELQDSTDAPAFSLDTEVEHPQQASGPLDADLSEALNSSQESGLPAEDSSAPGSEIGPNNVLQGDFESGQTAADSHDEAAVADSAGQQSEESVEVEAEFTPQSDTYESEPAPSDADFEFELDRVGLNTPTDGGPIQQDSAEAQSAEDAGPADASPAWSHTAEESGFGDLNSELADESRTDSFADVAASTPTPSEDQAAEAVRQLAIEMEETLTIVPWSEKQREAEPIQEQVEDQNSRLLDLRSGLETAKQFMSRSEYNKALDVLNKCYIDHPDDAHLKDMIGKAESGYMSKAADRGLGGGAIPKRTQRSLGQDEEQLPPQSSYLFSMIDGVTEIRALYWLAPMREVEVLRILDRLRDMGLVELLASPEPTEPSLASQNGEHGDSHPQ